MLALAEEAAPGLRAVAIRDVRLQRWLTVAPPVRIPITLTDAEPGSLRVMVGEHAAGVVELAADYPSAPPPSLPPGPGQPARMDADRLYSERIMFHGPAFQGVRDILGVSEDGVRAVLEVPPAPGSLLDNLGQLIGVWLQERDGESTVAFPVALDRVELYGPEPAPGERVDASIRVVALARETVAADGELRAGGKTVVRVRGWKDRRVLPDARAVPAFRAPHRATHGVRQPGGWTLVADRWPDLAGRDLVTGSYLGAVEREALDAATPRARAT